MRQYQAQSFPKTEGQVLSVGKISQAVSKRDVYYHPAFSYKYEVDGKSYKGVRYRFDGFLFDYKPVNQVVMAHPVGSTVEVYYNPADPADAVLSPLVDVQDASQMLLALPFLYVCLFFLLKIGREINWPGRVKPVAGGVKIITEGLTTRVRLPCFQPGSLGLSAACILSIIAGFVIPFTCAAFPVPAGLVALIITTGAGALVYFRQYRRIVSGIQDLVIDESARTVELPLTDKRRERRLRGQTETIAEPVRPRSRTSASPPISASATDEGRFPPGTLLLERYRVIALLGAGGMGEVYRASDLKLGQPVALKFLPEAIAEDERALARFRNEVRIARQVSHPNVCRVYDIGEFEGQHYISMEYVDGEDLASLLRRIGRLPADKALDIARRLCAGLAAAHEKGVLHRDLKPANVMLDGRGHVLITDFGLAGLAGQFQGADIRSGTPAYMAPEQLGSREVTARSDIYSLGLVLYEMFTGRRPFEAGTVDELVRMQSSASPVGPATVVRDLDPAVERVILRCLDPDPARRPASALAVAAGLPGGDPVAAALAAGETPSPEMVAAAGEGAEGIAPRLAAALLAVVVVGLIACAAFSGRIAMQSRMPFDTPVGALAGKAREILASLGYAGKPFDTAEGGDGDHQAFLHRHHISEVGMLLQRMHDRQFGGAGIAKQMRDALVLEQCEERRAPADTIHESPPLPAAVTDGVPAS